jgi:hypothetical protein
MGTHLTFFENGLDPSNIFARFFGGADVLNDSGGLLHSKEGDVFLTVLHLLTQLVAGLTP